MFPAANQSSELVDMLFGHLVSFSPMLKQLIVGRVSEDQLTIFKSERIV